MVPGCLSGALCGPHFLLVGGPPPPPEEQFAGMRGILQHELALTADDFDLPHKPILKLFFHEPSIPGHAPTVEGLRENTVPCNSLFLFVLADAASCSLCVINLARYQGPFVCQLFSCRRQLKKVRSHS